MSQIKVEKDKLSRIIEAARVAPTAVNKQPLKIWIAEGEQVVEKLKSACRYDFGATVFLVVGYKPDEAWVRKYDNHNFGEVDASIVATHIMMQIEEEGLASTWVGHFNAPKMYTLFPEMEGYELIAIFPIGYAAPDAQPAPKHMERKSIEELVTVLN